MSFGVVVSSGFWLGPVGQGGVGEGALLQILFVNHVDIAFRPLLPLLQDLIDFIEQVVGVADPIADAAVVVIEPRVSELRMSFVLVDGVAEIIFADLAEQCRTIIVKLCGFLPILPVVVLWLTRLHRVVLFQCIVDAAG